MSSDSPHLPKDAPEVRAAFRAYLQSVRSGEVTETTEFLAQQPPQLLPALEELLRDYQDLRELLGQPPRSRKEGRVLGDFRLLRRLGGGGSAEVWEAEQISLHRRVAVKLLHPHFGLSPRALQRFRREAQACGALQHENIVRILSMGEEDGVHFLVQELVEGGRSLADWLSKHRELAELPPDYPKQVARILLHVAEALHFAHEHGVIHRDVKPANILLGTTQSPKVADFGLALHDDDLTLSRTGELKGTPFYMSPEQTSGSRNLDARSDVFSLGATLYECLTLCRPFDGESSQQIVQAIRSQDPIDPTRLRRRIPRDLSWICLRALEKSPQHRYADMAQMAQDLQRFLQGEPVSASPPNRWRVVWRRCRQHPSLTTGCAVGFVSLLAIGGLFFQVWQEGERARTAESEAVAEALKAEAWSEDLEQIQEVLLEILRKIYPLEEKEDLPSWKEFLDKSVQTIELRLEDKPILAARLLKVIARIYVKLGEFDRGVELAEEVLQVHYRELGETHPDTAVQEHSVSLAYLKWNEVERAIQGMERALQVLSPLWGDRHEKVAEIQRNLGVATMLAGRPAQAIALLESALEAHEAGIGNPGDDLRAGMHLGTAYLQAGRKEDCQEILQRYLAPARDHFGSDHNTTQQAVYTLGYVLQSLKRYAEAEPYVRESIEYRGRTQGELDRQTLSCVYQLGVICIYTDRVAESEAHLRHALSGYLKILGEEDVQTANARYALASCLRIQKRHEEAKEILEPIFSWVPEQHPSYAQWHGVFEKLCRTIERKNAQTVESLD